MPTLFSTRASRNKQGVSEADKMMRRSYANQALDSALFGELSQELTQDQQRASLSNVPMSKLDDPCYSYRLKSAAADLLQVPPPQQQRSSIMSARIAYSNKLNVRATPKYRAAAGKADATPQIDDTNFNLMVVKSDASSQRSNNESSFPDKLSRRHNVSAVTTAKSPTHGLKWSNSRRPNLGMIIDRKVKKTLNEKKLKSLMSFTSGSMVLRPGTVITDELTIDGPTKSSTREQAMS